MVVPNRASARSSLVARAFANLVKIANGTGRMAAQAAMFILRTRGGFRETSVTELADADDKPLTIRFEWADAQEPPEPSGCSVR